MNEFNLEDRVTVLGKNVSGKIVYIGKTHFSEGEWFGVILDEAKGRNNGSIDGERYFKCPRNYGLFVRSCQLEKETCLEREPRKASSVTKLPYPNYLRRYKGIKSSEPEAKLSKGGKKAKSSTSQIHPMSAVIADLRNILKKRSDELSEMQALKHEAEEKLKIKEIELQKVSKNLKKMDDFKKEIASMQKDARTLKKKYKNEKPLNISGKRRRNLSVSNEKLKEIAERAIIEKEIAEEKSEYFEQLLKKEQDRCKALEVDIDVLKEEMEIQCISGVPAIHYVKELENRIEVLNCTLLKLADLYHGMKRQVSDYQKLLEDNFKEIESQKVAKRSLEESICKYREEEAGLCRTIDSMMNADDVVFELSERNLNFESTINNLYKELQDREDQIEISEEIEDTLQEINGICKEEIECLGSKIKSTQMALTRVFLILKDREETIVKYRELTTNLRKKNDKLSEELELVLKERNETVIAAENLKLKIYHEEKKTLEDVIQAENMKYDLESCKEQLNYWSQFMPEDFFIQGGENSAIQVKLIMNKILKKLDLIIRLTQSSYHRFNDKFGGNDLQYVSAEANFLVFACKLRGLLNIYSRCFDCADAEDFLALGKNLYIIRQKSDEIDVYLTFLSKGEIDRKCCLESIRNTYCTLSQLFDIKYISESEETLIRLGSYLKMIQVSCKCISAYALSLETLQSVPSAYKTDLKQAIKTLENLEVNANYILNSVIAYEREHVGLHPIVKGRLEKNCGFVGEMIDYINSFHEMFQGDKEFDTIEWESTKAVTLNAINCKLVQTDTDLNEFKKELNSGKLFVDNTPRSQNLSPVYTWAQRKAQEREMSIVSLKNKIKSCESEIITLTQSLQAQQKKYDDAQATINNKILKDASQQTEEFDANLLPSAGDSSTTVEFLTSKVYDMECCMRYLSQRNCNLMLASVKHQQEILAPLRVPLKAKYDPNMHTIFELQKKLNHAAIKLRAIFLPTVIDITKKNSSKKKKYQKYLLERTIIQNEIKNELWNVAVEVKRLKAAPRCIWSNTSEPFAFRSANYVTRSLMQ